MYVLLIIQTAKDGTVIPAAYKYGTLDEAKSAYYQELAAGASNDALASDACMVVDQAGGLVKVEYIEHKTEASPAETSDMSTEG